MLAVRFGGNVNNGANAGVVIFNANNAPSNSNWNYGGRNFPIPSQAGGMRTPPLKKNSEKHSTYFSGVGNN